MIPSQWVARECRPANSVERIRNNEIVAHALKFSQALPINTNRSPTMSSIPAKHRSVLRLVHEEMEGRHDARTTHKRRSAALTSNPALQVEPFEDRQLKSIIEETRRAAINPDLNPADPRWKLATATLNALDGAAINPTRRTNLLRLATQIGLRPFDANLIIAIVQDQARQQKLSHPLKFQNSELKNRLRIIPAPQTSSITSPTPPIPVPFTQRIEPVEHIDNQPSLINKQFIITATAITLLTTTILFLLINWLLTSS